MLTSEAKEIWDLTVSGFRIPAQRATLVSITAYSDPLPSAPLACVLGTANVAIYWVLSSQHKVNIFSFWMLARAGERSSDSAWESTQPVHQRLGSLHAGRPGLPTHMSRAESLQQLCDRGSLCSSKEEINNNNKSSVRCCQAHAFSKACKYLHNRQRCQYPQKYGTGGWVGKDAQ